MNIENVRYMLYQYHPQTALYIGHRFAQNSPEEGFMAGKKLRENESINFPPFLIFSGGGHIFSQKALRKLVEDIFPKSTPEKCNLKKDGFADDLITGEQNKKKLKILILLLLDFLRWMPST